MTPKAQQHAILVATGWTQSERWSDCWHAPKGWNGPITRIFGAPDFLNDLNAMHEAEKEISMDRSTEYWHNLFDIERRYQRSISAPTVIYMVRATAERRAEAFLRTLNLWYDSK